MSIEDMDAGQNALLAEVISLSPEVRRVKLLSAGKAALMLDVSVTVTNCGNTIDPEILPHFFDRFLRADPARSQGQSNHGLGLAIVGAIARMHQGKPVAWSKSGVTTVGIEIRSH